MQHSTANPRASSKTPHLLVHVAGCGISLLFNKVIQIPRSPVARHNPLLLLVVRWLLRLYANAAAPAVQKVGNVQQYSRGTCGGQYDACRAV